MHFVLFAGMGEGPEKEKTEIPLLVLLPGKGGKLEKAKIKTFEQLLEKFPVEIKDNSKETTEMAKIETPILLAARNGITEIVEQILKKFPLAINDKREGHQRIKPGKSIVLLAAKNRKPYVLKLLLEQDFVRHKLIHEVDNKGNNALHLAAMLRKQKPWLIPGAALQMQWEMKWYEV